MVELRWAIVELVAEGIVPWTRGEGVEASDASAGRQIVHAFGESIAAEDGQAVRHAFFGGKLKRMVARIDVLCVLLHLREGRLVRRVAKAEGDCVEPQCAFRSRWGKWRRIKVQGFRQVCAARSDICGADE